MFKFSLRRQSPSIVITSTAVLMASGSAVDAVWPAHPDKTRFQTAIDRALVRQDDTPIDTALGEYRQTEDASYNHQPFRSFAFDPSIGMSGNAWHYGDVYHLVIKGAPEEILAYSNLTENERERATLELHKLSAAGNHIVALADSFQSSPPTSLANLDSNIDLTFLGFIGVSAHIRPEAKQLVLDTQNKRGTVYLLTGKHREAALSIAKSAGFDISLDQVVDSRHFATTRQPKSDKLTARVFSRTIPSAKEAILTRIKQENPSIRIIGSIDDL